MSRQGIMASGPDFDAAVVGASLAGCTTAMLLARAGARVALIEKRADPQAYKKICSHFIQSSAVPTLERLGLMGELEAAGAVRSRFRMWTRWGWIVAPEHASVPASLNVRRSTLDPIVRAAAAGTAGVELMAGLAADELLRDGDGSFGGVIVRDRADARTPVRARLVVGADGRDSRVAELAAVRRREVPHGRFAYGAYFEGPPPPGAPDASVWFTDPQWAAAFPTDGGLVFYGCMPTKDRLPEFRRDPEAALLSFFADLPEPPPILASRRLDSVTGKLDMTNVDRGPVAPGLALVGDAALATDPLWGVGCGWALQSGEWLADSVAAALRGDEPLERGLARYRRVRARRLRAHTWLIHDYSSGRRLNPVERMLFSAGAADPVVADRLEAFGTRNMGAGSFFVSGLGRAAAVHARRKLLRRPAAAAEAARA
jgi:flavin-dependent dehydrogenase